jgi:hypothetical protein
MKYSILYSILTVMLTLWGSCTSKSVNSEAERKRPVPALVSAPLGEGFKDYWYQGKAELCTYTVEQERYGEMRSAEQVNIFVTEDFSASKQVKLDDPGKAGADRVPVLKLNALRRFHTGIYDYTLMQSVFTPVDGKPSLKATYSVIDWCGQVFSQFNRRENGYQARLFSYFESEGDPDVRLEHAMLEDELWTRLRINPATLPTGKVTLIPSPFFFRFRHIPYQKYDADVTVNTTGKESDLQVTYSTVPRSLSIRYETAFPHRILGWEETDNGRVLSKGVLKSSIMTDYWSRHDNASENLRDSLKLVF